MNLKFGEILSDLTLLQLIVETNSKDILAVKVLRLCGFFKFVKDVQVVNTYA